MIDGKKTIDEITDGERTLLAQVPIAASSFLAAAHMYGWTLWTIHPSRVSSSRKTAMVKKKQTSNNKHDKIPVKHLNVLHHKRKQKQLRHQLPSKTIKPTRGKLCCLSACKKWTPFLTYFWRHCKDIANLLLRVLWEYLIMPINNDSIVTF